MLQNINHSEFSGYNFYDYAGKLHWIMSVLNMSFSFILQSAIFNFQSLLTVILLLICTCAYIRAMAPSLLDKNKTGYDQILLEILNNEAEAEVSNTCLCLFEWDTMSYHIRVLLHSSSATCFHQHFNIQVNHQAALSIICRKACSLFISLSFHIMYVKCIIVIL